jgi:hypothetical protein
VARMSAFGGKADAAAVHNLSVSVTIGNVTTLYHSLGARLIVPMLGCTGAVRLQPRSPW